MSSKKRVKSLQMIMHVLILGGPPGYDDAMRHNQGMHGMKPM